MVPVFRNISLALAKDSNSSQLIVIRCCLFFKKNLNKSKGAGLDEISCRLILDCADLSASHILIMFKSSLANGIFPDDWKSARVAPLLSEEKEATQTIIVQYQLFL